MKGNFVLLIGILVSFHNQKVCWQHVKKRVQDKALRWAEHCQLKVDGSPDKISKWIKFLTCLCCSSSGNY